MEHADDNPRPNKRAKTHTASAQRQRAVRACDECRRLKEKCEGGMPCRRCQHLRRQCDFNVAPTTEKRSPAFADSIKDVMDRAQYMETLLKHHFPDLDLSTESLRRVCDTLSMPSPSLSRPSRSHQAPKATVQDTSQPSESPSIEDEGCTIDNVDGTIALYSGEFSHWNFSMHVKRNIDDLMAKANVPHVENEISKEVPTYIRVGEAHPNSFSMSEIIALLPPRPIAEFLKNVLFRYATSTYFIVEPGWIDSMMKALYDNSAALGAKDVTAACTLMMVLAVGTQYAHLESPKSPISSTADPQVSWELEIGSAFYQLVAKLLAEIIHSGSLLSVQSCLLMGLYSLPVDTSGLGYVYLNLAIKLAIQNGMHRKSAPSAFDARTEEVRRRVWWSAYCMERRVGIYHGRPASIQRSEIDVGLPFSEFDTVHSPALSSSSYLLQAINLTSQAEAFLREISLLRRCQSSDMTTIFRRIRQLKTSTRGWHPSGDGAIPVVAPSTRVEIHARLDHCLLEMFIGRPFILLHRRRRPTSQARQRHDSNANLPLGISPTGQEYGNMSSQPDAEWEFLVQDCVTAAKTAIDMCYTMQTGSLGLARASYVEYSSCRAGLLVLIAHSICYSTNEFASILQHGLSVMREMALAGESARSEVSLLENLEGSLRHLRGLNQAAQTTTTPSSAIQESYEGFADWYKSKSKASSATPVVAVANGTPGTLAQPSASNTTGTGGQDVVGMQFEPGFDSGPFDFDFDFFGSGTFPTPNYGQYSNAEKEFLESLPWIQD